LTKVYINLIDQKEPSLDFKSNSGNNAGRNLNTNISYSKKIIKPSETEIEMHKKFLKNNLKKNLF
jgi:DNA polymerase-3 subunit epsilon